jgi:hypothetical protein
MRIEIPPEFLGLLRRFVDIWINLQALPSV